MSSTQMPGQEASAILAALLGHELSHLFFKHPGHGRRQGILGELVGSMDLDRMQEKEADLLGLRVGCEAGLEPEGMLALMSLFAKLDPRTSSFMSNHPAAIERLNYLQSEVAECPRTQADRCSTGRLSLGPCWNSQAFPMEN